MSLCTGEELRPYIEGPIGADLGSPAIFIGKLNQAGDVVNVACIANYSGEDCEISLWSNGSLHRDFLRRGFSYVFDELGCTRASCRTPVDKPSAWHDALTRIGFVREGVMRRALNGADVIIYGMLREECLFHGR